ncbi:MAG: hypothetical protein ACRYFU_06630 [Janthinobacterium lividum]
MTNATEDREQIHPALQVRETTRLALIRCGSLVESNPFAVFGVLLVVYVFAQLRYSLAAPLWHDELFTFYIAQAPSMAGMLERIRAVDLNPPLSYLLTRVCFKLLGVGTLQCRLTEIVAFALGMFGIFLFVRRRAGVAFGLLAAALLFGSRAGELVYQARPYGLMLGMGGLALALWQISSCATAFRRVPVNLALFLALVALLLTHVFGLLVWGTIMLAEAAQSMERRRLAPERIAALVLPLASTLLYLPLLRNHAQSLFPPAFQPTGNDVFLFYMGHIDRELICVWLSAVVLVAIAGRTWLRGSTSFALTHPEWIAISGLIAAPLLLMGELMIRHAAFFDRYGVIACLGTAILFSVLFCWWTGGRPAAAVIAACLALMITGRLPDALAAITEGHVFRHTEPVVVPLATNLLTDAHLPLVAASGLAFLEMQRREPTSLLNRTFYLTDQQAAITFAHATIFEGLPEEARLFQLASRVEPYTGFIPQHPDFYVLGTYDYPEEWLLRKLQADGAQIEVLGRVAGSYNDHELYRVHVRLAPHEP